MLRITAGTSAGQAKSYYSTADYYTEGQELTGQWRGEGARLLGLSGEIAPIQWDSLCDNVDPRSGETLTLRQKENRRVGFDFNFHVPKSVSILQGLTDDDRLLDAFRESVQETMRDIESEMQTRVRKAGRNEDRITGNAVWGEFVHFTSRPVGEIPDPHLHAHCYLFNTTFDRDENTWKAAQIGDIKRDAPYFEATFHSRLGRKLAELGLEIERNKTGWEIAGIDRETIDKFSRRTEQIEEFARQKGISDPEQKSELGARTRQRKQKHIPMDDLRREWFSRLSDEEQGNLQRIADRIGSGPVTEDPAVAREAVHLAADHCFERKSVVPERTLLAQALKRSVGKSSSHTVHQQYQQGDFITKDRRGRRMVTTLDVLNEEQGMLRFAREGRGTCPKLGAGTHEFSRTWLNEGQRNAVHHVLSSRDRVILIRGAAGVGKTSMMQEAVEGIEAGGHQVFTFAPTARASRGVLREKGFSNADTIAKLLQDEQLHQQVAGNVIWLDEAGLIGSRMMARVFQLADKLDARVILSGDRYQHGSVERGAALRLLEEEAGLTPAAIKEIQRQKQDYKHAVLALSEGRTRDGFRQLDDLGWVREVSEDQRYKALAADYLDAVGSGESALVIAPTHLEGERCTNEIRSGLRQSGRLGTDQHRLTVLHNSNLTEAERADAIHYSPGDVLVFHQNAKGFTKGDRVTVAAEPPPVSQAARFQLFHSDVLDVATGDVLRITRNGKTPDGKHQLNNGDLVTIDRFDTEGNLVTDKGWTISRDYGFLAYGYAVTSMASQGMDVNRVFIGQSADSFPASSREQFYVSVSRGQRQATIYTDSKPDLLEAVCRSDERLSATELVSASRHPDRDQVRRQQQHDRDREKIQQERKELVYER